MPTRFSGFLLDKTKLQGPIPGTFEANILRGITVPYQELLRLAGSIRFQHNPCRSHAPPRQL
jgi:hypothetical protein